MRVLHVIDVAEPVGGAQIYLHEIVSQLAQAGHDVAVVHGDAAAAMPNGVPSAEYGTEAVNDWVTNFRPDVVHVHGSSLPVGMEAKLRDLPLIHSLHDMSFACASGSKYFRGGQICIDPTARGAS